MTHLTGLGAGMFSDLSVAMPATELTPAQINALTTESLFTALFAEEIAAIGGTKGTGTFARITNVREFPAMGVPANITNVPRFGAKVSAQIQGQADAPSMEIVMNYVAADWAKGAGQLLGNAVGDGVVRAFRFAMLNTEPVNGYASTAAELGTIPNSLFYFVGKLEAIVYNPQLTDANQATLTLSLLSDFYGAWTVNPV